MVGLLSYKIFPDKKLVVECLRGIVYVEDYIELKKREIADKDYCPTYNILLDLLGSDFKIYDLELHKLVDFLKNNPVFSGKKKVAILTDSPNQVVTAELFRLYYKNNNVSIRIASTLGTVTQSVGLNKNETQFILDTIKELTIIRYLPPKHQKQLKIVY